MSEERVDGFPGFTINAKKIAQGVFEMMSDDEQTGIKFGLLPKRWVDLIEKTAEEVVRKRLGNTDKDVFYGFVGRHFYEELNVKKCAAQITKQVCHKLYDCVQMVV
jgi:hypothetical protein